MLQLRQAGLRIASEAGDPVHTFRMVFLTFLVPLCVGLVICSFQPRQSRLVGAMASITQNLEVEVIAPIKKRLSGVTTTVVGSFRCRRGL
jgi:hypothetical protein